MGPEALIALIGLLPGLYFLYLKATKDEKDARRMLHGFNGDEYRQTEAGAMAIDDDNWTVWLYRE